MFGEEDNDGSEADPSTDNYISSLSFDPDVCPKPPFLFGGNFPNLPL